MTYDQTPDQDKHDTLLTDTPAEDRELAGSVMKRLGARADELPLAGLYTLDEITSASAHRQNLRRTGYGVAAAAAVIAIAVTISGWATTSRPTPTVTADESGLERSAGRAEIAELPWPSHFPDIQPVSTTSLPPLAPVPRAIVAVDDGYVSYDYDALLTSPDGIVWETVRGSDLADTQIADLVYANGTYAIAAVTRSPRDDERTETAFIATSTDLVTWSRFAVATAQLAPDSPWIRRRFSLGLAMNDAGVVGLFGDSIEPDLAAFGLEEGSLCSHGWSTETVTYQVCGETETRSIPVAEVEGAEISSNEFSSDQSLWFVAHADTETTGAGTADAPAAVEIKLPVIPTSGVPWDPGASIDTLTIGVADEFILTFHGSLYRSRDGQDLVPLLDLPVVLRRPLSSDVSAADDAMAFVRRSGSGSKIGILTTPDQWTTTNLNDLLGASIMRPVVSGSAEGWVVGGEIGGVVGNDHPILGPSRTFSFDRAGYTISGTYPESVSLADASGNEIDTWDIRGLSEGQLVPQPGLEVAIDDEVTLRLTDPNTPDAPVSITALELLMATEYGRDFADAESVVLFSPDGQTWGELARFPGQLTTLTMIHNQVIAVTHIGPNATLHKIVLE